MNAKKAKALRQQLRTTLREIPQHCFEQQPLRQTVVTRPVVQGDGSRKASLTR